MRVLWLLEELGDVPFELETRPLSHAYFKSEEYRALNPLGKVPVMFDGDERMVESVAMLEYISNKYADGRLSRKPEDKDYGRYLQWLHFGEAGMGGYVNMLVAQTALLPEEQRIPAMKKWAVHEVKKFLGFLEDGLGEDGYLLDEFSLADIAVGYPLFLIKITRNGELLQPKTASYFNRLRERDPWKRACAVSA